MNAFVRYTVMGIYKLFYNFRIEGWENVPEKEGVIIASNHRSYADPVILTMPMKRPVTSMAKAGVALIAAKSGADVLPMGIVFEGPKLHFRSKVTLKIGKLIKSEELDIGDGSPKQLKLIKKRIMDSITELVEGPKPEIASENAGAIAGNTENSADKAE